jgi:hypothetical protein
MMVMGQKYFLCLALSCCLMSVQAQDKKAKKFRFHSLNSLAFINGSNATTAGLQTVNGFSRGAWFGGIGLGLDYYQYRSVPLFADFRYEFGKKKTKPFIYADAGINFQWAQDYFYHDPSIWNNGGTNDFENGVYADVGIGINAYSKNGNAFVMSLGYSRKDMKEYYTYEDWRLRTPVTDVYSYRFNRAVLKLGYRFW